MVLVVYPSVALTKQSNEVLGSGNLPETDLQSFVASCIFLSHSPSKVHLVDLNLSRMCACSELRKNKTSE